VRVAGLKVDYLDDPLGLENRRPRLSWRLESHRRNVRQSAYRVRVASSREAVEAGVGDLWDSGKVASNKSIGIEYQGRELSSRQRFWWQVQIWDERDEASPPSASAWWEMGLLNPDDWTAQWLAVEDATAREDRKAEPRWIWGATSDHPVSRKFRHRFHLPVAARAGALFAENDACSLLNSIWLDGCPLAQWKDTDNTAGEWLEVGPLAAGEHVMAIEVAANFNPPIAVSMRPPPHGVAGFMRLALENGETFRLITDLNWKTALVADPDWHLPHYDERVWEAAQRSDWDDHAPWPAMSAMHLRREFSSDAEIIQARLYATALGVYEARLNGHRVGDALLTPEVSQYQQHLQYQVYDVTRMIRSGTNILGLTVGDGWYGSWQGLYAWGPAPRRVLAQLELTFADGTREVVATGPGWRIAHSPIRRSQVRRGEIYDARLEQPGWDSPGFDDSKWEKAEQGEAPSAALVAQLVPPIRTTQVLKPHAITQPRSGVYVVDFGQNFAGRCRLQAKGPRGARIELRFAEDITSAGEIDQFSLGIELSHFGRRELRTDTFILRGEASPEVFEPQFTYRGFRYVEITGLAAPPSTDSIEGLVIHSDLRVTGQLRTNSRLIERIWRSTVWTQRSTCVSIQTDNATREQRGWLGDPGTYWDAFSFHMDTCAFTSRTLMHWVDDQYEDGAFPMMSPYPKRELFMYGGHGSPPVYGDTAIILPWTAWLHYGDTALIERNWEPMRRHLQFIEEANPNYLWRNKRSLDWGDWLAVDEVWVFADSSAKRNTPTDLVATAYWAYSATLLAQMADAIGRTHEARQLREVFERVKQAFNEEFVAEDGTVGNGSQGSYVFALKFGLLSPRHAEVAAEKLAADIRRRGISLTTGHAGTSFLLDVLVDAGFTDLAYGLILKTEYPSWGYMLENGATALWENWRDVQPPSGSAHNQPTFASVCGFFFRRIAGIDASSPGFETIVIRPVLDERVKCGGGDYDSIMGRISTDWMQVSSDVFTLDVTLPANTRARVHLPAGHESRIEEGGQEISLYEAVRVTSRTDREAIVEVGSGRYRFLVAPMSDYTAR
jgi:alpha-L-rhamnosidase